MLSKVKSAFNQYSTNVTILACFSITLLYLISGFFPWLEILTSLVAIAFMFILPIQNAFCIFTYSHSFTLSALCPSLYFMAVFVSFPIVLMIKYIVGRRKNKYIFNKKLLISIIGFTLLYLIICNGKPFFWAGMKYVLYLPLFYFLYAMQEELNIHEALNYFFGGLVASSVLALLTLPLPYYAYNNLRINRFMGFSNNPNPLFIRAIFIMCYYMYRFLKKDLSNLKFLSILIICSFVTIATESKTGICMLALFMLIFIIQFLKQDFKKNIKFVLILIVIGALGALIFSKILISLFQRFAESFGSDNFINSLLTGRDDIWRVYWKACIDDAQGLIFGHGMLAPEIFVPEQNLRRNAHNLYIFLLYRFGIVGCVMLTFIIVAFVRNMLKNKPDICAYIPIAFLILESMFENTFQPYNVTLFAFCFMFMFNENKSNKQTEYQNKVKLSNSNE